MEITFLGTGAALSNGERLNTSIVFRSGSDLLLVDCSGAPAWSLARAGFDLVSVQQVFLTHEHVDHVYAIPSLVHSIWLSGYPGEGRQLRIFASASVLHLCRSMIGIFGLENKRAALDIDYVEVGKSGHERNVDIKLNGWRTQAFSVRHAGLDALGITLSKGEKRIVFTGDSEKLSDVSSMLGPGAMLIHDCGSGVEQGPGHASAWDIAEVVAGTGVHTVFLSHVPALSSEDARRAIDIVRSAGAREVIIPNDGDKISV